jgi:hypothetical protein
VLILISTVSESCLSQVSSYQAAPNDVKSRQVSIHLGPIYVRGTSGTILHANVLTSMLLFYRRRSWEKSRIGPPLPSRLVDKNARLGKGVRKPHLRIQQVEVKMSRGHLKHVYVQLSNNTPSVSDISRLHQFSNGAEKIHPIVRFPTA